jgi:hypothetical protein
MVSMAVDPYEELEEMKSCWRREEVLNSLVRVTVRRM